MKNKFKANIYEAEEWTLNGKKISCNIINDDMTKPPKWFQNWSETRFEPLVDKVNNIENNVKDLKDRMTKVETRLDTVIKLNNLQYQ